MNEMLSKGGLAGLFALSFCCASVAEVILVGPGTDTLAGAVAIANNGDVLELEAGVYSGAALTIGKNLTFRPVSPSDTVIVNLAGALTLGGAVGAVQTWQRITIDSTAVTLAGAGKQVTFQGMTFNNLTLNSNSTSGDVRIVESSFQESSILCDNASCGSSNWVLIGNSFTAASSGGYFDLRASGSLLIAGNTFDVSIPQAFFSSSYSNTSLIGNSFVMSESNGVIFEIGAQSTGFAGFIGNRVEARFDTTFGDTVSTPIIVLLNFCTEAQARNNLIRITDASGISTTGSGSRVTGINAIRLRACGIGSEISNNIIDYGGFNLGIESGPEEGAIHLETPGTVQNNIFTGITEDHFTFAPSTVLSNVFRNNLCHQTAVACTNLDGNQDADPLFVDSVDYVLGGGSPAIDAGPDSAFVLDIDGTTADLGLYGGQFPIDQFDLQRQPGRTAPFIYPLFNATRDVDTSGNVRIEVISAARLR